MDKILFIITGGTIDSMAEGYRGTSRFADNAESYIPAYLQSLKLYNKYEFTNICLKDSADITDVDRQKICDVILDSKYDNIIITHGTDTMVETAKYISARLNQVTKSILITGAMLPLEAKFSDGGFNLGFAIANLQNSDYGVSIAMHGEIFSPDNVRKDFDNMRFEELN